MAEPVTVQVPIAEASKLGRVLLRVSRIMAGIGAVAFGAMMIIIVIDVVGRYFFKHPLRGATELVGILLVIGASWGMGYCQLQEANIRIDVLFVKFSKKVQAIFLAIGYLVCLAVAALVAWQGFLKTEDYLMARVGNSTDILNLPLWPFVCVMAIGLAWVGFIFLVQIVKSINKAGKR